MIYGKYLTSRDDLSAVMALRRRVFVGEQGFAAKDEIDAHDAMAIYALVYDEMGAPAGTGRLFIDDDRFTIGRVCVAREARGQGFGDLVMRMLVLRARELCAPSVWLKAQLPTVAFYARYGFRPAGEIFFEEGVAHRLMRAMAAELDIEGSCGKGGACAGCARDCGDCAAGD